jgi:hypothetical protein
VRQNAKLQLPVVRHHQRLAGRDVGREGLADLQREKERGQVKGGGRDVSRRKQM